MNRYIVIFMVIALSFFVDVAIAAAWLYNALGRGVIAAIPTLGYFALSLYMFRELSNLYIRWVQPR